jgi:hypothetical protein
MIKTMSKDEYSVMKRMLPGLIAHLKKNTQKGTPSLLAKLQGVFKYKICWQPEIYFMLMTNSAKISDIQNTSICKFDLKGSMINRWVIPLLDYGGRLSNR